MKEVGLCAGAADVDVDGASLTFCLHPLTLPLHAFLSASLFLSFPLFLFSPFHPGPSFSFLLFNYHVLLLVRPVLFD